MFVDEENDELVLVGRSNRRGNVNAFKFFFDEPHALGTVHIPVFQLVMDYTICKTITGSHEGSTDLPVHLKQEMNPKLSLVSARKRDRNPPSSI